MDEVEEQNSRSQSPPDFSTKRRTKPASGRRKHRRRLIFISVISLAILVSGSWWFTHRNPDLTDVHVIISKVSQHYLLPSDESPALATVTDNTKLKTSFAGKVANGDKILIYQQHKQAIVYRPSIDRIIDVEPVSIDTPPGAQTTN